MIKESLTIYIIYDQIYTIYIVILDPVFPVGKLKYFSFELPVINNKKVNYLAGTQTTNAADHYY